ncbi:hypothetical protein MTO96_000344 [Rhipicephalus appendiculatus]
MSVTRMFVHPRWFDEAPTSSELYSGEADDSAVAGQGLSLGVNEAPRLQFVAADPVEDGPRGSGAQVEPGHHVEFVIVAARCEQAVK